MYVALPITHTFSRTTGRTRRKPYVVRVWYNIHINACPPLALSTISLIYDSHFLAYVPKVDIKRSLSALTLVVPRRAECIMSKLIWASRNWAFNGLNREGSNQHNEPSTASWNNHRIDDRRVLWLMKFRSWSICHNPPLLGWFYSTILWSVHQKMKVWGLGFCGGSCFFGMFLLTCTLPLNIIHTHVFVLAQSSSRCFLRHTSTCRPEHADLYHLSLQRELFLPHLRPRRAYPSSSRTYIPSSTTTIAIGPGSSIYKMTQKGSKTS